MSDDAFLAETRDSYTRIAVDYAETASTDPRPQLLEQALLGVFAERVRACAVGPVADVGCGPGRQTARLRDLGVEAFGIDLAPGMIEVAKRAYPELRFEVGSMLDLDLADGSLGGIHASYSIIHVPWELRPRVFAEFFRVLAPGGLLMLVFQVGDDRGHRSEAFGLPVSIDWYRQQPDEVSGLLRQAGFEMWVQAVREREGGEKVPQGYLIAGKPEASVSTERGQRHAVRRAG
jgi:SAM-dependent methyltransferase